MDLLLMIDQQPSCSHDSGEWKNLGMTSICGPCEINSYKTKYLLIGSEEQSRCEPVRWRVLKLALFCDSGICD